MSIESKNPLGVEEKLKCQAIQKIYKFFRLEHFN